MVKTSSRRGGFRTWEYYFSFGGGAPPWISGMAQATGIQAFARASQLLGDPSLLTYARDAFGAFQKRPPTGIATRGPLAGTHYLQYSFAPRLFIFNAFMQSVIGLYDYSTITGDATAQAALRPRRARGAAGGAAQRHRRLVALLLPRPRVDDGVPRAAARVHGGPLQPGEGDRVLLGRQALPRLHDRPGRARVHRARRPPPRARRPRSPSPSPSSRPWRSRSPRRARRR